MNHITCFKLLNKSNQAYLPNILIHYVEVKTLKATTDIVLSPPKPRMYKRYLGKDTSKDSIRNCLNKKDNIKDRIYHEDTCVFFLYTEVKLSIMDTQSF